MDEMLRDFYTKSEVDDKFGGMILEKISKADFDALTEKDPNTIYYVYDDQGKITQYVGEAELSGGTGAIISSSSTAFSSGAITNDFISGTAERVE